MRQYFCSAGAAAAALLLLAANSVFTFRVLAAAPAVVPTVETVVLQASRAVVMVILGGYAAGVTGWLLLVALRRDGVHRLETVAFLPRNYGGRSPFDTSSFV